MPLTAEEIAADWPKALELFRAHSASLPEADRVHVFTVPEYNTLRTNIEKNNTPKAAYEAIENTVKAITGLSMNSGEKALEFMTRALKQGGELKTQLEAAKQQLEAAKQQGGDTAKLNARIKELESIEATLKGSLTEKESKLSDLEGAVWKSEVDAFVNSGMDGLTFKGADGLTGEDAAKSAQQMAQLARLGLTQEYKVDKLTDGTLAFFDAQGRPMLDAKQSPKSAGVIIQEKFGHFLAKNDGSTGTGLPKGQPNTGNLDPKKFVSSSMEDIQNAIMAKHGISPAQGQKAYEAIETNANAAREYDELVSQVGAEKRKA